MITEYMDKQDIKNIVWNIPFGVKANCYLFALAPHIGKGGYAERPYKSTPGYKCKHFRNLPFNFTDCTDITERILCDNPIYVSKIDDARRNVAVSNDTHVICALLSPSFLRQDFHFLRRVPFDSILKSIDKFRKNMPLKTKLELELLLSNPPKYIWAHQRGWSKGGPLIHDANNNIILDPKKANFDYKSLNYNILCGYFKVKTRRATVYSKNNSEIKIKHKV